MVDVQPGFDEGVDGYEQAWTADSIVNFDKWYKNTASATVSLVVGLGVVVNTFKVSSQITQYQVLSKRIQLNFTYTWSSLYPNYYFYGFACNQSPRAFLDLIWRVKSVKSSASSLTELINLKTCIRICVKTFWIHMDG